MRSRALREGSVGLLVIAGLAMFAGLAVWLKDWGLGRRHYQITVEFLDARGLQVGTPVRYRGVTIGKVLEVKPQTTTVDVTLQMTEPQLLIPSDSIVEAQSSALLGEKFLDITPRRALLEADLALPMAKECDRTQVICAGSRLQGVAVADLADLVRAMNQIAGLLNNPELLASIERTANNAANATAGVSRLTQDLSRLSKSVEGEIGGVSDTIASAKSAADQASNTLTTADRTLTSVGGSATQAATAMGQAANQASALMAENRTAIARTLDSITSTSSSLQGTLGELSPIFTEVRQSDLLDNLTKLTSNLRIVSANLRVASNALNDPANLVLLQQTLDSVRVTFQNAQKITSDLDEITGDPKVRSNLRRLINGLSGLISSSQQLEQQVNLAHNLTPHGSPEQAVRLAQVSQAVNLESMQLLKQLVELSGRLEQAPPASPDPSP